MLRRLIEQLAQGRPLTEDQVAQSVEVLIDESVSAEEKADFLIQLAQKGETIEEITAFARALRARCVQPPIGADIRSREILDVVGTGGDHLSTFNISTTVAILASAAGVTVAKHGNRASTSKVGSADVIEALGLAVEVAPEEAARLLTELGFAFFFAPRYHPAFRNIAPARKLCAERGRATLFNYLGPLLNPARPTAALIGVPRPEMCEPFARVLQALGLRRAMVVCGEVPPNPAGKQYLDEFSPLGATTVAEFYQERGFSLSTLDPGLFPIQPATLADLRGGDREVNAAIIRRVLAGEERGPKRDAVLINAAGALLVGGAADSLQQGWDLAVELLDSGRAAEKLRQLAGG